MISRAAKSGGGGRLDPVKTTYESNEVAIPEAFLRADPPDAQPITMSRIDFEQTALPQYKKNYAVVLDHVLSPSECTQLIALAESSVREEDRQPEESGGSSAWKPALVNVGAGHEALLTEYRNSDRIIWDTQEVVDRLWARLDAQVPELRAQIGTFANGAFMGAFRPRKKKGAVDERPNTIFWDFERVNRRLRFLRYGPGQFFRPHCDGAYSEQGADGSVLRTHFTLHLYLNDSKQEVGESADLVGGATSFLSGDEKKKVDVDPKAGRVLIFQHAGLYHAGDDVKEGVKYTVRTDLLYKMRTEEEEEEPTPERPSDSAA